MSQTQIATARSPSQWCAALQAKLMAALDEAWAMAESSNDPAVQARARDKARLCGQMAATARKVATMVAAEKATKATKAEHPLDLIEDFVHRLDKATKAPEAPPPEARPEAAQAVAMRSALRKLKRR